MPKCTHGNIHSPFTIMLTLTHARTDAHTSGHPKRYHIINFSFILATFHIFSQVFFVVVSLLFEIFNQTKNRWSSINFHPHKQCKIAVDFAMSKIFKLAHWKPRYLMQYKIDCVCTLSSLVFAFCIFPKMNCILDVITFSIHLALDLCSPMWIRKYKHTARSSYASFFIGSWQPQNFNFRHSPISQTK